MKTNALYYGDNLDILRRYVADESVDLVYLDPPFNSNRDYNVIFKDESGRQSDAQLLAFEDTWHWGPDAESTYTYLTNSVAHGGVVPQAVSQIVGALKAGIGTNQLLAYVVEMAVRLVELHRVLKPTGSLYLHCDPTASHYLKLALDATFGPENFLSEISWKRTGTHSSARRWGPVHDVILAYAKQNGRHTWNRPYVPLDADYRRQHYAKVDAAGRAYSHGELTAPGTRNGRSGVPWRGFDVTGLGRHWTTTVERLDELDAAGRIYWPTEGGWPRVIRFEDEGKGRAVGDVWDDIAPLNMMAKERLGYPTQKPLALLERILEASSHPGDVVLDPFCGCGTAVVAAQKLGREWVGIDITYLSIAVMRARLKDAFPELPDVEVIGQPTEVEGARALALSPDGRYQFQWWALGLVDAQPLGGIQRKGADSGIDGVITFTDKGGELQRVLVSVKSGGVGRKDVADLKNSVEREKAAIGLFISLEDVTSPMRQEATLAGTYHSELWNRDYPRIQLLTIRELLEERRKPNLPPFVLPSFAKAQRVKADPGVEQRELFG